MSTDLVKSAARAFEIVEVFAAERRRMTATEIGDVLGYPKSSMNVLLKSLVAQGYLSCHPRDITYFPTLRLTQLGDWIPAALFGSDALVNTLEALRDRTHETVTLTMATGLNMRVLRVLLGKHPIALQLSEGYIFPIVGTAVGTAYLSSLAPDALEALLKRYHDQAPRNARPDLAGLRARIDHAREAGFVAAYDAVLDDTGAIAVPLVSEDLAETLVVAVAGLGARIKRHEGQIVRELMKWTRTIQSNASDPQRGSAA
jgi:DNA-binding IclR family transcriptional regulator